MKMKLTLLRGFQVIGEATLTLYPESVDTPESFRRTGEATRYQAEKIAEWMLSVEMAANANSKIRMHLEMLGD